MWRYQVLTRFEVICFTSDCIIAKNTEVDAYNNAAGYGRVGHMREEPDTAGLGTKGLKGDIY